MNACIRPCTLLSILLLMLAIGMLIWLGDIKEKRSGEYDLLNIGVQFGSIAFALLCLALHCFMFKVNGYFIFGSSNSYLLLILLILLTFAFFAISFMFSYVWMADRLLNIGLFLALAAFQTAFIGLSLFSQKASFDEFVLRAMKLNTKSGNPIDSRTASRLFRLKYGRPGNKPMFNDSELDRLRSYLIPENDDEDIERQLERNEYDPKNDGHYYSAPLVAL